MQEIKIGANEGGQRMDKFLRKFMPLAPVSFFYKMLRKKNITLNGKKAQGNEILSAGDILSLYLSDETIGRFRQGEIMTEEYERAYDCLKGIQVVYEDPHIMIMNKPVGILSQKADAKDASLNEWMVGYLLHQGSIFAGQLATYKPSVCNRLDRNSQGLVIGGKSLAGSQKMHELISSRRIGKFYRLFVKGQIEEENTLEGFLQKDPQSNRVSLVSEGDGGSYIKTRYYPIRQFQDRTLVETELITGKPHQIRLHMASIGHPLLGDYKYGDRKWNDKYKNKYGINRQLLCACRLVFPEMEAPFEALSRRTVEISLPEEFQKLMK